MRISSTFRLYPTSSFAQLLGYRVKNSTHRILEDYVVEKNVAQSSEVLRYFADLIALKAIWRDIG